LLKKWTLVFLILFFMPIVVGQGSDLSLDYTMGKGFITIEVLKGEHVGSAEFYTGHYDPNNLNYVDPLDRAKGNSLLKCNGRFCDGIFFERISIFEPGNYYFVVKDKSQNPVRINFVLGFDNLLSCDYTGTAIRNNQCVYDITKKDGDKPVFCRNAELVSSCAGPGFCGCPSEEHLCCSSPGGCRNGNGIVKTGECYVPGQEKFETNFTVTEPTQEVIVTETLGCNAFDSGIRTYNIGNETCLNSIPGLYIDGFFSKEHPEDNEFFAAQCSCTPLFDQFDKDGDGYDDNKFQGGSDCNDDPNSGGNVNPGVVESCSDGTGFDGIDNNCDGKVDLDCNNYCDQDGDGYTTHGICVLIGKEVGDCDDSNRNVNPGVNEVCTDDTGFDLLDNNCDGQIDESGCDCRPGKGRSVEGICKDGSQFCNNEGRWITLIPPVNQCDPAVLIHGYDTVGEIVVPSGQGIKIRTSFVCQQEECGKVNVDLLEVKG
jgi:hypothetical protein